MPSQLISPRMHGVAVGVLVGVNVLVGVTVVVGVIVLVGVTVAVGVGWMVESQTDAPAVGKEKPTFEISKMIRQAPVCWRPIRKRTSTLPPGASGVASVTVSTDMLELNPPPLNRSLGGAACSSVVPRTVRGPPLVVTTIA